MLVFECRIVAGAKNKKEVQTTHKNNVGGTATFEEILTFDKPLGEHTIKVIPQNTHTFYRGISFTLIRTHTSMHVHMHEHVCNIQFEFERIRTCKNEVCFVGVFSLRPW